jgi:hypothetical protein
VLRRRFAIYQFGKEVGFINSIEKKTVNSSGSGRQSSAALLSLSSG